MAPLHCKRTQVGIYNYGASYLPFSAHWVNANCPHRPGSILWRKCKRYLPADELKNENLYRPITSSKTNETYQNEYCAKCSGEKLDDLYPWKLLMFSNDSDSLSDPFLNAYDGKSMISHLPPTFLRNRSECTLPRIRKCNVTGMWGRYDERLIWACEKIPFTVLSFQLKMYKNVFCALCNSPRLEDLDYYTARPFIFTNSILKPQSGVFTELLRFTKPIEVRDYRIESRCPNEEIFSPALVRMILLFVTRCCSIDFSRKDTHHTTPLRKNEPRLEFLSRKISLA
jgi:hypothetical protein